MQKHIKKIQMLLKKKMDTKLHVVEEETHKKNITPKMSFYDWSLLIILDAYAIYSQFGLVIYAIFSCLSTCSCIGPIIKWHFWHNGKKNVLFKEKKTHI
jgi:hypothetical protein